MRLFIRFIAFLFSAASIAAVIGSVVVGYVIWMNTQDLPDYSQLQDYEPPVMTRVHASDGSLLAEYARERRLYLPIDVIPPLMIDAFLSAEDKNFYNHHGIDFMGMLRAFARNVTSGSQQGGSTITQQVAKNFFLNPERTYKRKLTEAVLAWKIEGTYSKNKILELYLNEIPLGQRSWGIAAASLNYFGKPVNELSLAQMAFLAALPKAPNNYHPIRNHDAAVERRNWVIRRMVENKFITSKEAEKALAEPLTMSPRGIDTSEMAASAYFTEEVRRELIERYGEKKLYEGGLSIRTTLDPKLQREARKAMMAGLVRYDEARGYRGPIKTVELGTDWGKAIVTEKRLDDVKPWRLAVVLDSAPTAAHVGLQPPLNQYGMPSDEREAGTITLDGVKWAKSARSGRAVTKVNQVLSPGDVVYVEPMRNGNYRLRQVPQVSGGMIVMDPNTGRVLAMVGGFSFQQSEFNRATQARRQPGSSFKPFIYAAALDNGYTPASVVMDAPIEINQGQAGTWRPENDSGKFYGPQTLRFGIEYSRNVMTVRLSQDMGMPIIAEYARRFGVYDDLPPYLSMALGAGETTVFRLTSGYGMIANGGKKLKPTLIDRIQDRYGKTIYRHDERECDGCNATAWENQDEPKLIDKTEQVIDPMTAYQVTSMMEGVVQRGTASSLKKLNRPLAGKTGTTNDAKDAWFVGYSPDLLAGLYVGYDNPRHLVNGHGGQLAAPIFAEFMKMALADQPAVPFRVPTGIKLIRINRKTGMRASGDGSFLEAFKPGTAPQDGYSVIGDGEGQGGPTASDDPGTVTGNAGLY